MNGGIGAVMDRLTVDELVGRLDRFPRHPMASVPTPLQQMPRLSEVVGGPNLWVKRDDLTGLALGGNKVRQLEFFVGAAKADNCDVFIGGGGYAQSNHARVCSAAALVAGMKPVIVVRPGGPPAVASTAGGNALLTRLFCSDARVAAELAAAPTDRAAELEARRTVFEAIAEEYRACGHRPYVLFGSSVPLGALGYVRAAIELQAQFDEIGLEPDWVVVTSLGVTQAGLEVASRVLGTGWQVCGMAYRPTGGGGGEIIARLARDAAELLGVELAISGEEVMNLDEVAGPDYAVPSARSRDAVRLAARHEALILDPVYTAKGIAGLLHACAHGLFRAGETVVFVHTGGQPALFAPSEVPSL